MKLALSAKITCDPKSIRENRWAHDTAHLFLHSVLKAQRAASGREKVRKH
ncbi:MAG: hypothetical protein KGL74_02500 [Elusimicrobia bacterium]|nr:hypothetical protein [Elusimicrobiota bacterium]